MSRRAFGNWGLSLDDDEFACALAAIGALTGFFGRTPRKL